MLHCYNAPESSGPSRHGEPRGERGGPKGQFEYMGKWQPEAVDLQAKGPKREERKPKTKKVLLFVWQFMVFALNRNNKEWPNHTSMQASTAPYVFFFSFLCKVIISEENFLQKKVCFGFDITGH
jgi:hypothetical protein